LPGGKEIVFSTLGGGCGFSPRLWTMAITESAPSRLPILGAGGLMPVVSASGRRLVYVLGGFDLNIWLFDRNHQEGVPWRARPLIAPTSVDGAQQISSDGERIVFASDRSGTTQIWVAASDGSEPVQLTFLERGAGSPRWSPNGKSVVFDGWTEGGAGIFVIDSRGGGSPRPVYVDEGKHTRPSWSHDGEWIYFTSEQTGSREIWKIPAEGGIPKRLTRQGGDHPFDSPDGRFVYYGGLDRASVWRVPAEGGEEIAVIAGVKTIEGDCWDVTNEGIYFVAEEQEPDSETRWMLKLFHFDSEEVTLVADLQGPSNGPTPPTPLDVSPDGSWFLWTRTDRRDSDLMLVENFR
jgi:Tol biopolymer transport system component